MILSDKENPEIELVDLSNREFVLRSIIEKIENYDFIIIDCPPALGLLTINAIVASDSIIIPLQCEFFALEGLTSLIKTIDLIKVNYNNKIFIEGFIKSHLKETGSAYASLGQDPLPRLHDLIALH